MWNPKNGEHVIMDGLLDMSIMKIPQIGFEQLDARIVDHIKRIHTVNGFSAVQTVEDTEKKRQKEEERKLNDSGRLCERIKRSILERACIWPCGWRTKICTGCKCGRES